MNTASATIALFQKAGEIASARRAVSEIIKWLNYVTDNRALTLAADLSESVNLEKGSARLQITLPRQGVSLLRLAW